MNRYIFFCLFFFTFPLFAADSNQLKLCENLFSSLAPQQNQLNPKATQFLISKFNTMYKKYSRENDLINKTTALIEKSVDKGLVYFYLLKGKLVGLKILSKKETNHLQLTLYNEGLTINDLDLFLYAMFNSQISYKYNSVSLYIENPFIDANTNLFSNNQLSSFLNYGFVKMKNVEVEMIFNESQRTEIKTMDYFDDPNSMSGSMASRRQQYQKQYTSSGVGRTVSLGYKITLQLKKLISIK